MNSYKSIYVIRNLELERVKIGISEDPKTRLSQISNSAGCNMEMVYCSEMCYNSEFIEKKIHNKLDKDRGIGEWFNCGHEYAVDVVTKIVNNHILTTFNKTQDINLYNYKRMKQGVYQKDGKLFSITYKDGNWDVKNIE